MIILKFDTPAIFKAIISSEVINFKKIIIDEIKKIVISYDVEKIVIGIPLNEDSSIGNQSYKVKDFSLIIKKELNIDVVGVDERVSSVDAEKMLLEQGLRRKKRKKVIDALAESIILQRYFENDDLVNI